MTASELPRTAGEQRLSDHISIALLTRLFPPELVDRVVAEAGRTEQRKRLLPMRLVVYFVLAMGLYGRASYEEVVSILMGVPGWAYACQPPSSAPSKAALSRARARLGPEPLRALFEQVALRPAGAQTTASCRGHRVVCFDAMSFDAADTPANAAAFGRARADRGGRSANLPQVRVMGLGECGTQALLGLAIAPAVDGDRALAAHILNDLRPGMVCLAHADLCSYDLWTRASQTGAQLVWRAGTSARFAVRQRLWDGSYLSELSDGRQGRSVVVRVVDCPVDDSARHDSDAPCRLLTTILDPRCAPASQLARLHLRCWDFERSLRDLLVLPEGRVFLRSKTPTMVIQELYGHLCVYYAICWLIHATHDGAATAADALAAHDDRPSTSLSQRAAS